MPISGSNGYRSGIVTLPNRVRIREMDSRIGLYPKIKRLGDEDRKGDGSVVPFDDREVVIFNREVDNLLFGSLVTTGSSQSLLPYAGNNNPNGGITSKGNKISGISDSFYMTDYKELSSRKNDNENINRQARILFKNGWSLMVYPQGTRAQKENFLPFKSGAFHIALENNVPILPVVIAGTGDIWPRGSKFMKSGKAIINTLDPIDISKYTKDSIDELVLETQEKMAKVYKELTASIK